MSHAQGTDRSVWAGLDAYPRFYAPIAIGLFCFSFATMFADQVRGNATIHFGSVWELASQASGGPTILAIMLMGAMVSLLVRVSVRTSRSSGWPMIIAALSAIALIMLFVRPGTGSPRPELADGGAVLTALCAVLLVVNVVHLVHLARIRAFLAASRQSRH